MPEFTFYEPGTPSWVDHATKDLSSSSAFYADLFGWEAEDQGEDMGHYTINRKAGSSVAGDMATMSPEQPCVWTTYVTVVDADATVELAKQAGGTVFVETMDVSDIGRMAVFADTTGAAIGVWQPKSFIGAELANEPGSFVWNELNTRDLTAAKSFYADVFGWEANDLDMGGMAYTEFKLGDKSIAGMLAMPDMVPADVPAHWLVYFGVEDTDATVTKASSAWIDCARPTDRHPAGALLGAHRP